MLVCITYLTELLLNNTNEIGIQTPLGVYLRLLILFRFCFFPVCSAWNIYVEQTIFKWCKILREKQRLYMQNRPFSCVIFSFSLASLQFVWWFTIHFSWATIFTKCFLSVVIWLKNTLSPTYLFFVHIFFVRTVKSIWYNLIGSGFQHYPAKRTVRGIFRLKFEELLQQFG